jgi:hypothetical protein
MPVSDAFAVGVDTKCRRITVTFTCPNALLRCRKVMHLHYLRQTVTFNRAAMSRENSFAP